MQVKSYTAIARENMWRPNCVQYISLVLCLLTAQGAASNVKAKVPALFSFGDSIFDPGNNNFLLTLAKADHAPYGQDFEGKKATGRCSNGKVSPDFIAAALGVKETVPPFLDPSLTTQDLLTGVSFASAATGFDNLTAEALNVIPILKQVELFKEYKARIEHLVGEQNASNIISQAIFLAVGGTNDFVDNYFILPGRRKQYSVAQYQDFLLQICSKFIEDIYKLGARKFAMYGMPPMGCLPLQKTLNGLLEVDGCLEKLNQVAISYNKKMRSNLRRLRSRLPGIKLVYVDIYDSFLDMVKYPAKHGFETSSRGCCGTGLIEILATCNVATPVTCSDPSKYVFWDSEHSTEKSYELSANIILQKYIPRLL